MCFWVQADIATQVASALDVALGDSVRRTLEVDPTANIAAYDAFLKGEAVSQAIAVSDPPSLRLAISFYGRAVTLDSSFVPAWTQLARAHATLYASSTPSPTEAEQARRATERAHALGINRPDGSLALGEFYRLVASDNRKALAALETGLRLAPNNIDLLGAAAVAEAGLGRWEAALQHLEKARALDPRSPSTARRIGVALLYLRRYREAGTALDKAFSLAPTNLAVIHDKALLALARGDLPGARGVVRAALEAGDTVAVLAFFASYSDLSWVLDDAQQRLLLTLPPSAFDNDRGIWATVRAQTYYLRGDKGHARRYPDSARLVYDDQLRSAPQDPQRHVFRGLALAYLDRKTEAIEAGERGLALSSVNEDAYGGVYDQHQLARIYVLVKEQEKALDQLEPLLPRPGYLSPGWLRIDPNFAPLRGNPRFERLRAGNRIQSS